jgi:hypothetical protein
MPTEPLPCSTVCEIACALIDPELYLLCLVVCEEVWNKMNG